MYLEVVYDFLNQFEEIIINKNVKLQNYKQKDNYNQFFAKEAENEIIRLFQILDVVRRALREAENEKNELRKKFVKENIHFEGRNVIKAGDLIKEYVKALKPLDYDNNK